MFAQGDGSVREHLHYVLKGRVGGVPNPARPVPRPRLPRVRPGLLDNRDDLVAIVPAHPGPKPFIYVCRLSPVGVVAGVQVDFSGRAEEPCGDDGGLDGRFESPGVVRDRPHEVREGVWVGNDPLRLSRPRPGRHGGCNGWVRGRIDAEGVVSRRGVEARDAPSGRGGEGFDVQLPLSRLCRLWGECQRGDG